MSNYESNSQEIQVKNIFINQNIIKALEKSEKDKDDINTLMKYFETTFFLKKLIDSKLEKKLLDNIKYFLTLNGRFEFHKKDDILFRIADKGEKFYIIIQGTVGVLKPKQITKSITIREYLSILHKLKQTKENYLYEKIVNANVEKFLIKERLFSKLIEIQTKVITTERIYNRRNSSNNNYLSNNSNKANNNIYGNEDDELYFLDKNDNDFKDLSEYYFIIKENKKYTFCLEEYEKIIELKSGFSFGDYALESMNRLRTATIRMESDCYFAVIKQEDYSNYILNEKKSAKMKEFKFLYEGFFHKNFDREKFEKFYFSEFIYEEYPIGHILEIESNSSDDYFCESNNNNNNTINNKKSKLNLNNEINIINTNGNNNNYSNYVTSLYLIKEGQVEISLNKSLVELFNLIKNLINCNSSLNSILDVSAYTNYLQKKLKTHAKELTKKRNLSIMKIGVNDILGAEEFYFKMPFLFQAKVVSEKLGVYKLTQDGLNKIIDREGITRKFMQEHTLIKISNKISRLVNLNKTFLKIIDNEIEEIKINLEKKLKRDKMKTVVMDEKDSKEILNKKENNSKSRNVNLSLYDKTSNIQKNINNIITGCPGSFCFPNSFDVLNDNLSFIGNGIKNESGSLNNAETNLSNYSKDENLKFSRFKKNDLLNSFGGAGSVNFTKANNNNSFIGKIKLEASDNNNNNNKNNYYCNKIVDTVESNNLVNTNIAAYKSQTRKINQNKVCEERENSPTIFNSTKKSYSNRKSIISKSPINSPNLSYNQVNRRIEFLEAKVFYNLNNLNNNSIDNKKNEAINLYEKNKNNSSRSLGKINIDGIAKTDFSNLLRNLVKNVNNINNNQIQIHEKEKKLKAEIYLNRKKSIVIETPLYNKFSRIEQILNVPEMIPSMDNLNKWKRGSIDFAYFKNKASGKLDSSINLKLGLMNVFNKLGENEQITSTALDNLTIFKSETESVVLNNKENSGKNKKENNSVNFSECSSETFNEKELNLKENINKKDLMQKGNANTFGNNPNKHFDFENKHLGVTNDNLSGRIIRKPNSGLNKYADSNNTNINKPYNINLLNKLKQNGEKTRNNKSDFFSNKLINLKTYSKKISFDEKNNNLNSLNNINNNGKTLDNNFEFIESANESKNTNIYNNKTLDYLKPNNPDSKYNVNFNLYLNLNLNTGNPENNNNNNNNNNQKDKQSTINNYYYKGSKSISKKPNLESEAKRMKNTLKQNLKAPNIHLDKILNDLKNKNLKISATDFSQENNSNSPSNRINSSKLNSERSNNNQINFGPHIQKSIESLTNLKVYFNDPLNPVANSKQNDYYYNNNNYNNNSESYLDNKPKSNSEQKNYFYNSIMVNSNVCNSYRNVYYKNNLNFDSKNANENYSCERNYYASEINNNNNNNSEYNTQRNNISNTVNAFELKSFDFDHVMSSLPRIKNLNKLSENTGQRNVFIPRNNANISLKKYYSKEKRIKK